MRESQPSWGGLPKRRSLPCVSLCKFATIAEHLPLDKEGRWTLGPTSQKAADDSNSSKLHRKVAKKHLAIG